MHQRTRRVHEQQRARHIEQPRESRTRDGIHGAAEAVVDPAGKLAETWAEQRSVDHEGAERGGSCEAKPQPAEAGDSEA